MTNKKFTEKEEMVIKAIMAESNFNFDKIDVTKSWNEQRFESCVYYAFADVKDYGCGMSKQQTRAIFGSLVKKGCIWISKDEDVEWITIGEEEFNNIREYLG